MRGPKDLLQVVADYFGNSAPKADPDLKDPRSTLAIAIYKKLDNMTGSDLLKLLRDITNDETKAGTRTALLKQVKRLINDALQVDSKDDVHGPMAAWKMWPLVINRKDRKMATNKQATKKKTASKKASKKKVSKKARTQSKGTSKKTVAKKKTAAAGRKGKPAAAKLQKPLKKDSKRGAVLAQFLGKKTITAEGAAKSLKTNRSNVLSHLHDLNKYNGIGYELDGDGPVSVTLPKGCKSPWV